MAFELSKGKITINEIIKKIEEINEDLVNNSDFYEFTPNRFKSDGFYDWRGIKLLNFMEKRWGLRFGDREDKIKFLGLGFVELKQNSISNSIL